MEKPEWVYNLFNKAENDRELLDIVVAVLKNELNYKHDDFCFLEPSKTLLIRNVVAISWNHDQQMYIIGLSVTTESLGVAVLIQCILMNGITNIKFQDSFYICDYEKDVDGSPSVYYGKEATDKYMDEVYARHKEKATKELIAESVLMTQDNANKTFH